MHEDPKQSCGFQEPCLGAAPSCLPLRLQAVAIYPMCTELWRKELGNIGMEDLPTSLPSPGPEELIGRVG